MEVAPEPRPAPGRRGHDCLSVRRAGAAATSRYAQRHEVTYDIVPTYANKLTMDSVNRHLIYVSKLTMDFANRFLGPFARFGKRPAEESQRKPSRANYRRAAPRGKEGRGRSPTPSWPGARWARAASERARRSTAGRRWRAGEAGAGSPGPVAELVRAAGSMARKRSGQRRRASSRARPADAGRRPGPRGSISK